MPVRTFWDDPEQMTMLLKLEGDWTIDEFMLAAEEVVRLTRQIKRDDVVVIVDATVGRNLPLDQNILPQIRNMLQSANIGYLVVVGASPLGQRLVKMVQLILPQWRGRLLTTPTIDEAYSKIYAVRS